MYNCSNVVLNSVQIVVPIKSEMKDDQGVDCTCFEVQGKIV